VFDLACRRPAWHALAACKTAPAEVTWFPEKGGSTVAARAVCAACAACPVLAACDAWAETQGPRLFGIWAGVTERERRAGRQGVTATGRQ